MRAADSARVVHLCAARASHFRTQIANTCTAADAGVMNVRRPEACQSNVNPVSGVSVALRHEKISRASVKEIFLGMMLSGKVTIDLAKPKTFYARYQDAQARYAQNRASGVAELRLVQFEQIGTGIRERSRYCARRY